MVSPERPALPPAPLNRPSIAQSPNKQSTRRKSTCYPWAIGECVAKEEDCPLNNAQDLFPIVINRSDPMARKTMTCKYWQKGKC